MEFLHLCLKSRYPLNPNFLSRLSSLFLLPKTPPFPSTPEYLLHSCRGFRLCVVPPFVSAPIIHSITGYSSISANAYGYRFACTCELIADRFGSHRNHGGFRHFSACVNDLSSSEATTSSENDGIAELNELIAPNFVVESIVNVVRRDEVDMEFWLGSIGKELSKCDAVEALRTLNRLGLNACRLFHWIRKANPHVADDLIVCGLMVDNCGRIGDYQTMLALLKDFSVKRIVLTDVAFGFLHTLCSSEEELRCSVERLVNILKEADGTCRYSGIDALIKMCCSMNCFDLAKLVVGLNKTEAAFYRVWLRESCKRGQFQETRDMIHEMRKIGCDLDNITYGYLMSCMWKHGRLEEACTMLEEMIEGGSPANALAFEVLICGFCKDNDLERAVKLYELMVSHGIEPRFSTCAAIIKAYFNSQRYEEAYNYLMHLSVTQKWLINRAYSLLANLHRKQGDLIVAYKLLMEMIEKGLKPDFSVYVNVSKKLFNTRRKDLARILKNSFNSLVHQASNN